MVEIKVDLKRNSKEDIKKVIEFLQKFIEDDSISNTPDISPAAFNLFSNQETTTPSTADKPDDGEDNNPDESDLQIKPIFY